MSGKKCILEDDEEGEILDSDEDGTDKKAAERRKVDQSKKVDTEEMDLVSDEELDGVIDTEPLAMSVVFEEKSSERKSLRDNLILRFGDAAVVEDEKSISLYLSRAIKSMIKGKVDEGRASRRRSNAEFIVCEETAKKLKEDPKIELVSGSRVPDESANMVEGNSSLVSEETDNSSLKIPELLKHSPCDSSNHTKIENSEFSDEILNVVTSGFAAITVKFHDRKFSDCFFKDILSMFENIFGSSYVTSSDGLIEVFKSPKVDFEIDTSRYGERKYLRYSVRAKLHDVGDEKKSNSRPVDCFNCGGQHSLNECRVQRNYQVINANREKFRKSKNRRYHTEIEKFSGLGPGFISPALRKALGLGLKQLPRYIYEMRKHGYPPGWLEEARVKHSGVAIYGVGGEVPEEGDEDGQVFEEGEKDKYDIKKIVKYPGFNTPAEPDFIDECEIFDCPPFSEEQDVNHMIKQLMPNAYQAYQKKRMQNKQDSSNSLSQDGLASEKPSRTLEETALPARQIIVEPGTPIGPSVSPYTKLPPREKFCENINDVIFFDNLPNSTGVYKKVAESVAKIREYSSKNAT